jgi:hypothetical protein
VKRFTETEKWRDTWFRKLAPDSKLAFLYVVDNCDAAGVWDPDYDLANFTIGREINWPGVLADLGDRVSCLHNGKWHLTRFVEFQYGELVEECRPHAKVLALLKAHEIPYKKGIYRVSIPTRIRIGQDKDRTGSEGGTGETVGAPAAAEREATAEEIYAAYPRKEARQDALRAIGKALTKRSAGELLRATRAYAAAVATWIPDDRKFVPHPATWFNGGRYEDDPKTWERARPVALPMMR